MRMLGKNVPNKRLTKPKPYSIMLNEPKNKHAVALGKLGGKVGGKSKSLAKQSASRANGKRGGRPKKKAE